MISCYNHFIIQDISGWDIRKVENLEYMFWYAYAFKQNLCSWRVKDFPFNKCSGIFGGSGCQNKGNPVDTSSPFCESHCFKCFENRGALVNAVNSCNAPSKQTSGECTSQKEVHGWPMSEWCFGPGVTDMSSLFAGAREFNEDIRNWDVSKVTNMGEMFSGAFTFNQDISQWDVSRVTNMRGMFRNARKFDQVRRELFVCMHLERYGSSTPCHYY